MAKPVTKAVAIAACTAFAGVSLGAAWLFLYEPGYSGEHVRAADTPEVWAHRGFGNYGPDNSLYGVNQALDLGVDGVDVDGQLTADGELVIFHDLSVDRLTSEQGRVADKTLDEMLAMDLGPKFDPQITGAWVHTFEDFVVACEGRGQLMVELKATSMGDTGIEAQAIAVLQKHNAHDRVLLSSFNPIVLWRLKQLDPNVHTVYIFMDTNWNEKLRAEIKDGDLVDLPWFLRKEWIRRAIRKIVKPDLLSVNITVDPATTERLIARGWPIFLWSPISEQETTDALGKRPHGLISDEVHLAKKLRDATQR